MVVYSRCFRQGKLTSPSRLEGLGATAYSRWTPPEDEAEFKEDMAQHFSDQRAGELPAVAKAEPAPPDSPVSITNAAKPQVADLDTLK